MILRILHILAYLIYTENLDGKHYYCHFTEKELRLMKVNILATWTLHRYTE